MSTRISDKKIFYWSQAMPITLVIMIYKNVCAHKNKFLLREESGVQICIALKPNICEINAFEDRIILLNGTFCYQKNL